MNERSIALRYGVDLVWDGDFVTTLDGDLATQSGRETVKQAVIKRLLSDGLPWDASYGARPRGYVDAPDAACDPLVGSFAQQAMLDDRVSRAKCVPQFDGSGDAVFLMEIDLVADTDPLILSVPLT